MKLNQSGSAFATQDANTFATQRPRAAKPPKNSKNGDFRHKWSFYRTTMSMRSKSQYVRTLILPVHSSFPHEIPFEFNSNFCNRGFCTVSGVPSPQLW